MNMSGSSLQRFFHRYGVSMKCLAHVPAMSAKPNSLAPLSTATALIAGMGGRVVLQQLRLALLSTGAEVEAGVEVARGPFGVRARLGARAGEVDALRGGAV